MLDPGPGAYFSTLNAGVVAAGARLNGEVQRFAAEGQAAGMVAERVHWARAGQGVQSVPENATVMVSWCRRVRVGTHRRLVRP